MKAPSFPPPLQQQTDCARHSSRGWYNGKPVFRDVIPAAVGTGGVAESSAHEAKVGSRKLGEVGKHRAEIGGRDAEPACKGRSILVHRGAWQPTAFGLGVARTAENELRILPVHRAALDRVAHDEMVIAPGVIGATAGR